MGGRNSGTPPARELVETALAAVSEGTLSLREAARKFGVDRTTLAKYRDGQFFRRKRRRCPSCGHVVAMPCLACSAAVQTAAARLQKRRLAKAPRRRETT